ncbi:RNA polymerase I enhancer binding protein, partial [Coemansia sp. RSA 2399]
TLNSSDKQLRKLFWPILAEALPARQIQAIYHHVRRKYHPHNYMGAWTAGEDDELCRLVAAHGLAWETIAQQMGRTGTNCRDHWRYIRYGPRSQGLPQQQQQQQQHQAQDPVLLGVSSAVSRNVEAANKAGQSICGDSAGDVAPIVPT